MRHFTQWKTPRKSLKVKGFCSLLHVMVEHNLDHLCSYVHYKSFQHRREKGELEGWSSLIFKSSIGFNFYHRKFSCWLISFPLNWLLSSPCIPIQCVQAWNQLLWYVHTVWKEALEGANFGELQRKYHWRNKVWEFHDISLLKQI